MLNFIVDQFVFFTSVAFLLFLPGRFLLLAIFGKRNVFTYFESFIISFGLSFVSINFLFFLYERFEIPITRFSSLVGIIFFLFITLLIYKFRKFPKKLEENKFLEIFSFSKKQFFLILIVILLSFFIRHEYLSETISPNSTDLGHHMYWAKWITENHRLPNYEGMPDFIIGEHIIFGITSLISGINFFHAFPVAILFLFNLLSIFTIFILTLRIFKNQNIAILALFFIGVFYAVSSPQAKFISGGVVGNILGNFLMPLAFYFYYRSFSLINEDFPASLKDAKLFFALALFITVGLFYTHHLTSFMFLFIFFLFLIMFFLFHWKNIKNVFLKMLKLAFSRQSLIILGLSLVFFLFIFTPTYFKKSAIDTAIGTPLKETRTGLSFENLISSNGETRLVLGLIGLIMLLVAFKNNKIGYALIIAWTIIIYFMSTSPKFLFIDLPSNRIGSYFSFPLSILSAYALITFFSFAKKSTSFFLFRIIFLVLLTLVIFNGIFDSTKTLGKQNDFEDLTQTFSASKYLAQKTDFSDKILKDHNYINGDAWIKLFFMKGYKYPDSRGYFKRYEDKTKPREMCTLWMISSPNSNEAKRCFMEKQTNFIMINPSFDSQQFKKLDFFDQVYLSPHIAIYYRNK